MKRQRRQWVIFDGREFFSGKTLADHIAGLAGMNTARVSWQLLPGERKYIMRLGGEVVFEFDYDEATRTVTLRNQK